MKFYSLKIFKKCETDSISKTLMEESRKLINSLQANLKHEEAFFENERNQLYEFIEKLSLDFQDVADKNSIKIEIPKFELIPLPVEKEAEVDEANMEELEKKYEETEKHLIDALDDNNERLKYLSQIDIERHMKDLTSNKNSDNFFLTNNNFSNTNNNNIDNNNNNLNPENVDSNNNALSNSKLNASHVSKHRLLNMSTERIQKLEKENENNLSRISDNKLINDKNESEKHEDENIINKLNTSKAQEQEGNEEDDVKKSLVNDPELIADNIDNEEDNYYLNTHGEKIKKIKETNLDHLENNPENNLNIENKEIENLENQNEDDNLAKKELGDPIIEGDENNEIKAEDNQIKKENDEEANKQEPVENAEMQDNNEGNQSVIKSMENLNENINSSKLLENVDKGKFNLN